MLDPFCGCATACLAAEKLGCRWARIDLSSKVVELANVRLREFMGELFYDRLVTVWTNIPHRADLEAPIPLRQNRHISFGQHEDLCAGCKTSFPFRQFEVDHVVPRSRGVTDHIDNLQLLCGHCTATGSRVTGRRNIFSCA